MLWGVGFLLRGFWGGGGAEGKGLRSVEAVGGWVSLCGKGGSG